MLGDQVAGTAIVWIAYGIAVGAAPVVVANALVAGMAFLSARRRSPRRRESAKQKIA
jgi:hypothetical protein